MVSIGAVDFGRFEAGVLWQFDLHMVAVHEVQLNLCSLFACIKVNTAASRQLNSPVCGVNPLVMLQISCLLSSGLRKDA